MDLPYLPDVEFFGIQWVDVVRVSAADRKRIASGALHIFNRLLRTGFKPLRRSDRMENLALHKSAVPVGVFHDLACFAQILLERIFRAVEHHRGKAVLNAGDAPLDRIAVIQMEDEVGVVALGISLCHCV